MKTILGRMPVITALIAAAYGAPAGAQTMDYGSLESLFGEPVTTSATGTPQRASDVPVNMTIINADQIRQSGSRNIAQIIGEYVPGINVLQSGIPDFNVGVRGYQQPLQPRLDVLIDGRQVFLDDFSFTDWSALPVNINDIRQIEVVKGAASALFGSNATGGVVNIITYSPLYDKNNVADAGVGTQTERNADATATAHFGDWGGVKISGGVLGEDEFSTPRSIAEPPLDPYARYVSANSVFQINPTLQGTLEATYDKQAYNQASYNYSIGAITHEDSSFRGSLSWQSPLGTISNNTYLNNDRFDGGALTGITSLFVSQFQDQFKAGPDNTFRIMFEYRNETFDTAFDSATFLQSPSFNKKEYALGGTWLWNITDKLSFTNALRGDHNVASMGGTLFPESIYTASDYSQEYNTVSANSGLVYKATDLDSFRATYGRGVQNPSLIQSGYNFASFTPIFPGLVLDDEGNPNLKPTIVSNYELGYDRKIPYIDSTVKLSVYYEFNQDFNRAAPCRPRAVYRLYSCYIRAGSELGRQQGPGRGNRNCRQNAERVPLGCQLQLPDGAGSRPCLPDARLFRVGAGEPIPAVARLYERPVGV